MTDHAGNGRSTVELLRQLSEQTTRLVRDEVDLAKADLGEKSRRAGLGAGMLGGAGVLGLYALGALTTAAIAALSLTLATWLAALIVAAAWTVIAGGAALLGKRKVQQALEDVHMTTTRARSGRT